MNYNALPHIESCINDCSLLFQTRTSTRTNTPGYRFRQQYLPQLDMRSEEETEDTARGHQSSLQSLSEVSDSCLCLKYKYKHNINPHVSISINGLH